MQGSRLVFQQLLSSNTLTHITWFKSCWVAELVCNHGWSCRPDTLERRAIFKNYVCPFLFHSLVKCKCLSNGNGSNVKGVITTLFFLGVSLFDMVRSQENIENLRCQWMTLENSVVLNYNSLFSLFLIGWKVFSFGFSFKKWTRHLVFLVFNCQVWLVNISLIK